MFFLSSSDHLSFGFIQTFSQKLKVPGLVAHWKGRNTFRRSLSFFWTRLPNRIRAEVREMFCEQDQHKTHFRFRRTGINSSKKEPVILIFLGWNFAAPKNRKVRDGSRPAGDSGRVRSRTERPDVAVGRVPIAQCLDHTDLKISALSRHNSVFQSHQPLLSRCPNLVVQSIMSIPPVPFVSILSIWSVAFSYNNLIYSNM